MSIYEFSSSTVRMVEAKGPPMQLPKYQDCNQGSWLAFLCRWPHPTIGRSEWGTKRKQDRYKLVRSQTSGPTGKSRLNQQIFWIFWKTETPLGESMDNLSHTVSKWGFAWLPSQTVLNTLLLLDLSPSLQGVAEGERKSVVCISSLPFLSATLLLGFKSC